MLHKISVVIAKKRQFFAQKNWRKYFKNHNIGSYRVFKRKYFRAKNIFVDGKFLTAILTVDAKG
jgi:hypothetical protein